MATRRSLAGGAFAALLGTARAAMAGQSQVSLSSEGMSGAHPDDAKLIAIGREATALVDNHHGGAAARRSNASGADDAEIELFVQRMHELSERALSLKATTLEAMRPKAVLVQNDLRIAGETSEEGFDFDPAQGLAWSLVADMTGRA